MRKRLIALLLTAGLVATGEHAASAQPDDRPPATCNRGTATAHGTVPESAHRAHEAIPCH